MKAYPLLLIVAIFLLSSCKDDTLIEPSNFKLKFTTQPVSGTTQAF